jgi:dTDP-4-amino-4,6-dideoxygalactose transaminase
VPVSRLPPSGNAVPLAGLLKPYPGDFRQTFSAHSGFAAENTLYTGSGTAALELALRALKTLYPDRDEVVLPAWCCPSVGQAILAAKLRPIQADLHPGTFAYAPDALNRTVTEKTLTVLLVHYFGIAHAKPELRHPPPFFLRDCAQDYDFRNAGESDVAAFYSFGRGKSLNTGHGGALCLPPHALLGDACRKILESFPRPSRSPLPKAVLIEALSRPAAFGFLSRLPFLGIGRTVWDTYPEPTRVHPAFFQWAHVCAQTLEAHRQAYAGLAREYARALGEIPGACLPRAEYGPDQLPLRFPCLMPVEIRKRLREGLNRKFGGVTGQYPDLMERLPGVPDSWPRGGRFPGCERMAREMLTFPVSAWVFGREGEFLEEIRRLGRTGH